MLCLKTAGRVANRVDPDETPRSAASHLGLLCLLRPICPNTYCKYGTSRVFFVANPQPDVCTQMCVPFRDSLFEPQGQNCNLSHTRPAKTD